jgi:hypothetical protein
MKVKVDGLTSAAVDVAAPLQSGAPKKKSPDAENLDNLSRHATELYR